MVPPLYLLSLNQDVLRGILAHLLLDTPPERNRPSILSTCSLLHELGLPLLYRIVDLRGFRSTFNFLEQWRMMFGDGGVLVEEGRREGVGKMVKELRLGGEPVPRSFGSSKGYRDDLAADAASLINQEVSLPSCSQLVVDVWHFDGLLRYLLGPLLPHLPITQLRVEYEQDPFNPSEGFDLLAFPSFESDLDSLLFGSSHCPWKDLHTVVFHQCLCSEVPFLSPDGYPALSSSLWSFKVLAIEITPNASVDVSNPAVLVDSFLRPRADDQDRFLIDTERIELRTSGPEAGRFEDELRKRVATGRTNASLRRIFDMVVFVGDDGKETSLMEGSA